MLKFLLAALVCAPTAWAQSSNSASPPRFLWASTPGAAILDSVAVDQLGNCYAAGFFGEAGKEDGVLNKYDATGNLLWSRQYGGSGKDDVRQVTLDTDGSLLVAGEFTGTVDFGNTNLTAQGGSDMFLAKISSDGDCIWVVQGGGEADDFGESISIDGEGNCYVGGFINSTNATFGPFTLSARPITCGGCNPADPFIAKYDSSGQIQWIQQISTPHYYWFGMRVAANPTSGVYVTGSLSGVGVFGPTNLTSSVPKIFLASFGPDGGLRWVNEAGEDTNGYGSYGTGVAAGTNGDVYLTGFFSAPVIHFGQLSVTNPVADGYYPDIFLAKYDEQGAVHWVTSAGGADWDWPRRITLDNHGDVYLTGSFRGSVINFGGVLFTNYSIFRSAFDGFIAKYASSGQIIWLQQISGSFSEEPWDMVLDKAGNGFIVGWNSSTDLSFGQLQLPSPPGQNGFVAKFETTVPPLLVARRTGPSTTELSWCALAEGFYVETSASLQSDANWRSNSIPVERVGTTNRVIINSSSGGAFYRLKRLSP